MKIKKKIPANALRFDASLEVGKRVEFAAGDEPSKGLAPVPVTLRARSADVVNHWWFGRTIHDFAGMKTSGPKLPLDYCHYCDEVVGFSDKQDVSSGELVMSGQLVPFHEKDRASEVLHKGGNGVPYQASITFDPGSLVIEEVPPGMSAQVNGKEQAGPLTIFRQWTLLGAAVCPYGMDSNTSVQFSNQNSGQVEVEYLGELAKEPEEKPAEPEAKPEEKPVAELTAEAADDAAKPDEEIVPVPEPPKTELAAVIVPPVAPAPNGKQFLEAFGAQGGVWFAEGKSFDEAQVLYIKSLKDEATALSSKVTARDKTIAEQAALLSANRGEASPLTFTSAEETVVPKSKTVSVMPDGMAKFAANIKMPRS